MSAGDLFGIAPTLHLCLFLSKATFGPDGFDIRRLEMASAVAPTFANIPMTISNYTLPPPIYLPSSGGYTSSRFVEDVSAFNVIQNIRPLA